jgi:hypothetical protein
LALPRFEKLFWYFPRVDRVYQIQCNVDCAFCLFRCFNSSCFVQFVSRNKVFCVLILRVYPQKKPLIQFMNILWKCRLQHYLKFNPLLYSSFSTFHIIIVLSEFSDKGSTANILFRKIIESHVTTGTGKLLIYIFIGFPEGNTTKWLSCHIYFFLLGQRKYVQNRLSQNIIYGIQTEHSFSFSINCVRYSPWMTLGINNKKSWTFQVISDSFNFGVFTFPLRYGWCMKAVQKVSSHFEYLENRSRGLDVTWPPVIRDFTVHTWTATLP